MTTPTYLNASQEEALADAKELHARGLYYCPADIAGHSVARALVRRGMLFTKDGVRHEETGREGRAYGVAGLVYPDTDPTRRAEIIAALTGHGADFD